VRINRRRFWIGVTLVALLLGLAEAMQVHFGAGLAGRPVTWHRALSATMPSWLVSVAFLPLIIAAARRYTMQKGRRLRDLARHVPLSFAYAIGHLALASWLSDYVLYRQHPLPYLTNLYRLLAVYLLMQIFFYWAFVVAVWAYDYYLKYREHERAAARLELRASRLEAGLAHANLETLRMQLNPHFLFNTLNTISVLALKGEGRTVARMLSRLSELLRMVLENTQQVTSLRDELEVLDRYLEIEQVRFRDRLTVSMDVDPEVLDAEVPSLVLQPIVENAIWHGIAQMPGEGRIEVGARRADGRLVVRVRDTGPGFGVPARPSRKHGVGLANTRARLEQLYGDEHELSLTNAPDGGAVVTLALPFRAHVSGDGELAAGLSRASW
jgi:two-component system, LytTR family, sensor kinase